MNNKRTIICVPTYIRPIYLEKNLNSLVEQDCKYTYEIAVVDNDINQSAKPVVDKYKDSKIKCGYYTENKRGISAVRNKCIEICKEKNADYLVFIDDDEIAEKNWLQSLLDTSQKYNAEVVSGPVLCEFEKSPSNAIQNNFFIRSRIKTGSVIENCATNNVLIDMNIFKEKPQLTFNENFGLMGGEDTHFFMHVKAFNFKLIWCDEAILHEFISKERSELKNCLLRSFYKGNSLFYIFKMSGEKELNLRYVGGNLTKLPNEKQTTIKYKFNISILILKLVFRIIKLMFSILIYTIKIKKFDQTLSLINRLFETAGFLICLMKPLKNNQYKNIFGE